jgi:hypothetical protein
MSPRVDHGDPRWRANDIEYLSDQVVHETTKVNINLIAEWMIEIPSSCAFAPARSKEIGYRMSSGYSVNGQDPRIASSPVRATSAWKPFVPLRATSNPFSGLRTYTVALSLRCAGSELNLQIARQRLNRARLLGRRLILRADCQ